MKVSTKGRYGVRAVLELALRQGAGPMLVREISENQKISERYLENILNALRKSGIVTSTRGAGGGYQLTRSPAEITVGDVVRSLEGPLDVVECTGSRQCGRLENCAAFHVWNKLKTVIERELDGTTIADMVNMDRDLSSRIINNYHI
jgi:Rrf2 family transcriptional regulator, cysteine metabolism repressor